MAESLHEKVQIVVFSAVHRHLKYCGGALDRILNRRTEERFLEEKLSPGPDKDAAFVHTTHVGLLVTHFKFQLV